MLIFYGVIFILIEVFNRNRKYVINSVSDISFKTAFLIGLFQVLALVPGTSRSGVTILGAMLLFCSREVACEFSFFLGSLVIVLASFYKGIKFFMFNSIYLSDLLLLLIGVIVSFLVSVLVIKLLLKYIKTNDFKAFGVYRIILGVLLILFFYFK